MKFRVTEELFNNWQNCSDEAENEIFTALFYKFLPCIKKMEPYSANDILMAEVFAGPTEEGDKMTGSFYFVRNNVKNKKVKWQGEEEFHHYFARRLKLDMQTALHRRIEKEKKEREEGKILEVVELDKPIKDKDGEDIPLYDITEDPRSLNEEEFIEIWGKSYSKILPEDFNEFYDSLSPELKDTVKVYLEEISTSSQDLSHREVLEKIRTRLNISESTLSPRLTRIRKEFVEFLERKKKAKMLNNIGG